MSKKQIKTEDTATREQYIQDHLGVIDSLTQFEMARMLRFMPSGHIYFDNRLP
jgi:hypothetical protein